MVAQLPSVTLYDAYDRNLRDFDDIECYKDGQHVMTVHENGGWFDENLRLQDGDMFTACCRNLMDFTVRIHFTMGDADFSGTIDEDDLYCIHGYLEDNYNSHLNFSASDLNHDGSIDVLDYVALHHIVAGSTPEATTLGNNNLIMSDLKLNSERKPLPVIINNANDIVALQFDLKLPEGCWPSLWWDLFTDRTVGEFDYNTNEISYKDGICTYRIVVYSTTGSTLISSGEGEAFSIMIYRNDYLNASTYRLEVENVVFATTDSRNAFTSAQLGTIDFNMQADDEEWNILQLANLTALDKEGSQVPFWDFSGGPSTAKNLQGVTIKDGHIAELRLDGSKLVGPFPFLLTTLPYLELLHIYNNQLSGDIGEQAEAFRQTNPVVSEKLLRIDVDNCELSGNVGPMISLYPNLEILYFRNNHLTDIAPLPEHSFNLNVTGQRLDDVTIDLNTQTMSVEEFVSQLPNIVRYDRYSNALSNDIHVYCSRGSDNILDVSTHADGRFEFWTNGSRYENAELFNAVCNDNKFNMRYYYVMGDANFDGQIDVADVQNMANCVSYNDFHGWNKCNVAASDLNNDETVNVLDIVLLIDRLLKQGVISTARPEHPLAGAAIENGQLVIQTTESVAAFDITVSGCDALTLSNDLQASGLTCTMQEQNGQVRIVAYSLSGSQLPVGKTVIGQTGAEGARVANVTLVDIQARHIPTAISTGTATGVHGTTTDTGSQTKYELRLGHGHSIHVDEQGHKTLYNK